MNPFFQDESNAVYHGNALTILPCLPFESVDAVITDPPYCSGAVTLSGKQADPVVKYQKTGTKKGYPSMLGDAKDQRVLAHRPRRGSASCLHGLEATPKRDRRRAGRRLDVAGARRLA